MVWPQGPAATAGALFGFTCVALAAILRRAAVCSLAFVVRAIDFQMNHIRK
jgi:hypothetical protein